MGFEPMTTGLQKDNMLYMQYGSHGNIGNARNEF